MNRLYKCLFAFSLFLVGIRAESQLARQYSFKHFSVINGLASNTVSSTMQDDEGYIWLATVNGLQRYDGSTFLTFKSKRANPETIPSNYILTLFQDKKKRLWLSADNNKIGIFDTKKFVFTEASLPPENRKYYMPVKFLEPSSGELMLLKEDGTLLRYDESANRFVFAPNAFPCPPNWKRNTILWDTTRSCYWMSCDSGMVQYVPKTGHLNYRGHNVDNDPVINGFLNQKGLARVLVDRRGNVISELWAPHAGAPTVFRFNVANRKLEDMNFGYQIGYHEIGGFLQQRNGKLWIYGMPFFAEWTDAKEPFQFLPRENREQTPNFDYISHCMEDREENIWMSSDNGVYLFNPGEQIFNTYNVIRNDGKPAQDRAVQAIAQTSDGRTFVGCWGGDGIYCYDKNFNPVSLPPAMKLGGYLSVWDMAINDRTKDLWITLQAGGIAIYSPKTGSYRVLYPEVFGGSTIRQADEDTSGNIWFGTHDGRIVKWDYRLSGGDPAKGYQLIYRTGQVMKLHYDYQGFIYVGALGQGLLKIDARTGKYVKTFSASGPPGEQLYMDTPGDMTYYDDTTLVISAGCLNILNTKTGKIRFISAEDGLPSNTTQSVEKDKYGILWLGMTNGICRLNLQKKLITYYDRRDGISFDRFLMAGAKHLRDGRLAFFTDHNFLLFDPAKFGQEIRPPVPHITAFQLGGKAMSVDSLMKEGRAVLRYNNTSFAVNFSALTFHQQQKMHYYYKLENLDPDWIQADQPMEVSYNYLPPGNYRFVVKTENADGLAAKVVASLPIVVRPPIWKTWWFYSLLALLVIGILYLLDRERMNKMRSVQEVRRQIRSNLGTEVSTTLNNINVLSEIAKIKADKDVQQAKDFIDQISDKSRDMIEAMEDTLWSIDPANDNMKKIVLRIKELTDGMRVAYDSEIDLIVDHKVQLMELDMKLRHDLFFFYKEAMNFILRHLECDQIFVNLNKVKSKLLLEILCECDSTTEDIRGQFQAAMAGRISAVSADMDIIADPKSFAVVLYIDVS